MKKGQWHIIVRTRGDLGLAKKKYKSLFHSELVRTYLQSLANSDNIELRLNSVPLTIIFHNLIAEISKMAQADKTLALEFLKGYEAGDGSINVRKGCLHDINITVKDFKMKNILKNLFTFLYGIKLNERMTKGAYEISCSNINAITRLIIDGHFSDHKSQWLKLLNAYSKKEYTRSHINYWRIIYKNTLPVLEIAEAAKRSHWSVRDALNKDLNLGIVSRERKMGPNGYHYNVYRLKENGIKVINNLKEAGIVG